MRTYYVIMSYYSWYLTQPQSGLMLVLKLDLWICLNTRRSGQRRVLDLEVSWNPRKWNPALTVCVWLHVLQRREAYPSENGQPCRAEETSSAKWRPVSDNISSRWDLLRPEDFLVGVNVCFNWPKKHLHVTDSLSFCLTFSLFPFLWNLLSLLQKTAIYKIHLRFGDLSVADYAVSVKLPVKGHLGNMTHVVSFSIYFRGPHTSISSEWLSSVKHTQSQVPFIAETSHSFRCEDEQSVSQCDQSCPDPVESLEMSRCCRPPP